MPTRYSLDDIEGLPSTNALLLSNSILKTIFSSSSTAGSRSPVHISKREPVHENVPIQELTLSDFFVYVLIKLDLLGSFSIPFSLHRTPISALLFSSLSGCP
jgi:hypothetical protein